MRVLVGGSPLVNYLKAIIGALRKSYDEILEDCRIRDEFLIKLFNERREFLKDLPPLIKKTIRVCLPDKEANIKEKLRREYKSIKSIIPGCDCGGHVEDWKCAECQAHICSVCCKKMDKRHTCDPCLSKICPDCGTYMVGELCLFCGFSKDGKVDFYLVDWTGITAEQQDMVDKVNNLRPKFVLDKKLEKLQADLLYSDSEKWSDNAREFARRHDDELKLKGRFMKFNKIINMLNNLGTMNMNILNKAYVELSKR